MPHKLDMRTMQFLQRLKREGPLNVNTLDPSMAWSLTGRGFCRIRTTRAADLFGSEVVLLELTEAGKLALEAQEGNHANA